MLERVLMVGLGSIGRRHARLIHELVPGVKIAALRHAAAPDLQHRDVDVCYATMDEALQFRPQVAVIANPASFHLDAALPLARAGVHLLVEKPLSNGIDRAPELIEVCHANKSMLMVGYNMRFLPSLQRFRELLTSRRVGRVLSVRAEAGQYLPLWRPEADYRNTVSAKNSLGGGVLLELSHEFDYLRWLFGEVEWVSAIAVRQSSLEIDVEDTVHIVLGFAGARDGAKLIASLNMDFIRRDATRSCTVIGESGSLRWNALTGSIEIFEPASSAWQLLLSAPSQRDDSYIAEWRHIFDCLNSGAEPLVSGEDGLAVMRIVDAVRRSASARSVAAVEHSRPAASRRNA